VTTLRPLKTQDKCQSLRDKGALELRLWGAAGRLSFTGGAASRRYPGAEATRAITQPWVKAAKTWAARLSAP